MGWLIAACVLLLLAVLPLGVSARYDDAGIAVRVIAGPGKVRLYPREKRGKPDTKSGKIPHAAREKPGHDTENVDFNVKQNTEKSTEHAGGSWTDFLPLVKTGLNLLNAFRRKLRVDRFDLRLIMSGGDPCDLAVNYGRAWAAVGGLLPNLERVFVIRERNIAVECDFTADKTTVLFRIDITITLGRLVGLGAVYGLRALKNFLQIKKKRKGGALE